MEFKDTFLYFSVSRVWRNWSSMNAYQAALSFPVFAFCVLISIFMSVIIDGFFAIKKLLLNE